jgi:hypothetical protein
MKIRSSFVSNSSSTSFCIMGIFKDVENEEEYEKIDLYTHYSEESNGIYVGLQIGDMKDNETKAQFKERAKMGIIDAGIEENPAVGIITEGWYNG